MKTPEHWQHECNQLYGSCPSTFKIREIQADALRHAADIAESYDNQSHHGNDMMTKQNVASEIRAAAMPNVES